MKTDTAIICTTVLQTIHIVSMCQNYIQIHSNIYKGYTTDTAEGGDTIGMFGPVF